MALLDLSKVTETLTNLLEYSFLSSETWNPTSGTYVSPTISAKPPDALDPDSVGIYLYHIAEDTAYKNLPSPGYDNPPVRFIPMGLNLFYQLTARGSGDENGTINEQKMMGIAMKALHDYPVIDDETVIVALDDSVNKVLPDELDGDNKLRIILQPIAHNEAMNYWSAGNNPPRLAAYYQVSVVLLEPEEIQSRPGRVLTYGVHTFVEGPPRIDTCKNTISFTIPGETEAREVELSPAQASPVATPLPDPLPDPLPIGHKVSFTGSGFLVGDTSLILMNERWTEIEEVDPTAWQIEVTNDGLDMVIRERVTDSDKEVLPGIYAAVAKVIKQIKLPDGTTRDIEYLSNKCPFAISPRIDTIDPPDANNISTIEGYIFQHADIPEDKVIVYYGGTRLASRTAGTLDPGEFSIIDAENIKVRLPDNSVENTFISGNPYPIRIFVNGIESAPAWIDYPS